MSNIEWTEKTWNPTTGCDLLSPGCNHCYAKTMSHRLMMMGQPKYSNGFGLTLHPSTLDLPTTWRKPTMVFVNSMSDLFHDQVPLSYIQQVFSVMRETPQHTYQILTKRSGRMWAVSDQIDWPDNVWMGVSVESPKYIQRVVHLLNTNAKVKFVSYEPALEYVNFEYPLELWPNGPPMCCSGIECGCMGKPTEPPLLYGLDWIIVGGESGPGARPFDLDWARGVVGVCKGTRVKCFVKQMGSNPYDSSLTATGESKIIKLKDKKGGDMSEWPQDLHVREMPTRDLSTRGHLHEAPATITA